jgi:SagB-type dehydrogenase family enzyme
MKKVSLFFLSLIISTNMMAQEIIQLPEPNKNVSTTLFQALQERHSVRNFEDKSIDMPTLSQILWAAIGVNRTDGRMTAPTAVNAQEISVYVATKDGVYLYLNKENALKVISKQDIRKEIADRQTGVANAPVFLIIVSDLGKIRSKVGDRALMMTAKDAGYVSQNICLGAVALGLGTVPRHGMNREVIKSVLGLGNNHELMLNHPIGYPRK